MSSRVSRGQSEKPDAVMETSEAWAAKLRARNVGDFPKWKDHDAYKATFERVLRDLMTER